MKHRDFVSVLFLSLFVACTMYGAETQNNAAWKDASFKISETAPQTGWRSGSIKPAAWKPVSQPDLESRLAGAPQLELIDSAPPPQRCWIGHQPYVVPNPGGKSWDMIFPYYNKYRGEQEVVIHDFGSGTTSRQRLSTRTGTSVLTREPVGFHMQPSYYTDGKLVFEMYGPVILLIYDPQENRFTYGTKPFGDEVINGRCTLGPDGMIYGMGWPKDKSGFVAYRFNPKTYEAKRYKVFGPANPNRRELYRKLVLSGDWLYAGIGSRPWHLAAFNIKTQEGRLLAETKPILGDYTTINMKKVKGGVSCTIHDAAHIAGVADFDEKECHIWLHNGTVSKRSGSVPPWSDKPAEEVRPPQFAWDREFQVWPDTFTPPSQPPLFKKDGGKPDGRGQVALKYRFDQKRAWKTLSYQVTMYPGMFRRLKEINSHVLFATDDGYGQHVFYCLKTHRIMRVGGTLSPYSIGLCKGKLYVSGYPSSQMYEYDFGRPIGLRETEPNPRFLGYIAKKIDTHCPLAGTVCGSDGNIYCAGTTYGRRREGGGFGWYNPEDGSIGGEPFEGHRFFWMTCACKGRFILLSSKLGGNGELFCWDSQKHTMVYQKTLFGGGRPGPLVEALPEGLVIGHHDKGILYGLKAETGEILWKKKVPSGPVTSFSQVRRHAYCFRRGPDGFIWSFFGKTLVRIDPRTAYIEPVGKVGDPAQIAFANGTIYMAGGNRLREIKLPEEGF